MRYIAMTIGTLRRLRGWASRTFLRPASVTLDRRPAAPCPVDPTTCARHGERVA